MTWVRIDDSAPQHPKLLSVGAAPAWLWLCGLAYCNRQKRKDGIIPKAAVKLLYPGLGEKQASALVAAGLWERIEGGYQVHDYLEYQGERTPKAEAGSVGGSRSTDAKRQAALHREQRKREAQADEHKQSTSTTSAPPQATTNPIPSHPIPVPSQRPATEIQDLSGLRAVPPAPEPRQQGNPGLIPCPPDLMLTAAQVATLETSGIQREAIAPLVARFVAKHVIDPDDKRSLKTWLKCLSSSVSGDWNDPRRRPKPPGAEEHERRQAEAARPIPASVRAVMGNLLRDLR